MDYYIDGSSRGNPGDGGWGIVVIKDDDIYEKIGSYVAAPVTNNEMEITALIHCLYYIVSIYNDKRAVIYTDSMYNINAYKNVVSWLTKKDLKNKNYIKTLLQVKLSLKKHKYEVTLKKVKGHSDDEWNKEVDKLATHCAKHKTYSFYKYKLPNKISECMLKNN